MKLYIKWDEKLTFYAREVDILESKNKGNIDYAKLFKNSRSLISYIDKFDIDTIRYNKNEYSLHYNSNDDGKLKLQSTKIDIDATIESSDSFVYIDLSSLKLNNTPLVANAKIAIDVKDQFKTYIKSSIDINSTSLDLYAIINETKAHYFLSSKESILNPHEIVRLFNVDEDIKYWVDDAIKIKSLDLAYIKGYVDFNDIANSYKHLEAKATANEVEYTYDKNLQAVSSKYTQLAFYNSTLFIYPKEAYSYKFYLDKSYLEIDFDRLALKLNLDFRAKLNSDILSILHNYGIDLPLKQKIGYCDSKLILDINLSSLDTKAKGEFKTKEAQLEYLGYDIDVENLQVLLDNTKIKTNLFKASYKNIASSYTSLNYDASSQNGVLNSKIDKFNLDEYDLALRNSTNLTYYITKDKGAMDIQKSSWLFKNRPLELDAINDVHIDNTSGIVDIKPTTIALDSIAKATSDAKIDLKNATLDMNVAMQELNFLDITVQDKQNRLKLRYDEQVKLTSLEPLYIKIFDKDSILKDVDISISKDSINTKATKLEFSDTLKATFDTIYNLKDNSAIFSIKKIDIDNFRDENINLYLKDMKNYHSIYIPKYETTIDVDNKGFNAKVKKLDYILKKADLFSKYDIKTTDLVVEKKAKDDSIILKTTILNAPKILTDKNELIDTYVIDAIYNTINATTSLNINQKLHLLIDKDIKAYANGVGFNLDEVLEFIKGDDKKQKPNFYLKANDSYIYISENRFFIFDNMNLSYRDENLNIDFNHKDAKAKLTLDGDNFSFYGDRFGDEFMSNLFTLSKFKDGHLKFSMDGKIDNFSGVILIEDSTVLSYRVLNNILAFINTVPSLMTFSLPGYNKDGLQTQNIYVRFNHSNDKYTLSDIYLKSKEIEIVGQGSASVVDNYIDLELNLKSDIGSTFSKLPVVGKLLMNNETLSTTLKVDGELKDPQVHTQLAKDIAVAPLNIIKRALMFPVELFK